MGNPPNAAESGHPSARPNVFAYRWSIVPGRLFVRDNGLAREAIADIDHDAGRVLLSGMIAPHLIGYAVALVLRSLPGQREPRLLLPATTRVLPAGWRWFNGYACRVFTV